MLRLLPITLFVSAAAAQTPMPRPVAIPPAPPAMRALPAGPAAVAFDIPRPGGDLWAIGRTWKARFDGRGFDYVPCFGAAAPRNFPLRVELQSATAGGTPLALRPGTPARDGARVHTDRGALTETVDAGLDGLEQSFVFERLPQRGELAVELSLTGEFAATATAAGIHFANPHGAVDYAHAVAHDAQGRARDLPIQWSGERARIVIPADFVAAAALPLVLDPILSTTGLAPGWSNQNAQRDPDVARLGDGTTAVVWQRDYSATDRDAILQLLDGNGVPTAAEAWLDMTSEDWTAPRIAGCDAAGNFLIVAQVGWGGARFVSARTVSPTLGASPVFDIERAGVIGVPGDTLHPDVGGNDGAAGTPCYWVVFEKALANGDHDIYARAVSPAGAVLGTGPVPFAAGAEVAQNPSISSSFRSDIALITWQQTSLFPPFLDQVWATCIVSGGGWLFGPGQIAAGTLAHARPSASSPANLTGLLCFAIAFETDYGTDHDIEVRLVDSNGAAVGPLHVLNQVEGNGAWLLRDQRFPTVETDGNRFAIGYSESSGTDFDTYLSTSAYSIPQGTWRLDDERAPCGTHAGTDDYWTRLVSDWDFGSNQPNAMYTVVGAAIGTNTIEVTRYGGWRPGTAFSAFGSQCGNLPISATGMPATGSWLQFDLTTSGPFAGFLFGFPGYQPLGVCSCVLGVANGVTVPGPHFVWYVPADPVFVNAFTLSIQGWAFGGTACLGALDLSDTLDFTIH